MDESIEDIASNPKFFDLPTESVFRIIKESKTTDIKLLCSIVKSMSLYKSEEAPLILNIIDSDDGSLDDYIEIVSCLRSCPICKRISDIIERNKTLPFIDYPGIIKDREAEIAEKEAEISRLKEMVSTLSREVSVLRTKETKKQNNTQEMEKSISELKKREPFNFESDIFKAAKKNDVSSIEYLVEQKNVDINKENWRGNTPLEIAIKEESLQAVKYFVETCKQEITDKIRTAFSSSNNTEIKTYFTKPIRSSYKIVCFGFACAGKSVLVKKFVTGFFDYESTPTIAAACAERSLNINNKEIKLIIWDTAGHEPSQCLMPIYSRDADVIILFHDRVRSQSPEDLLNAYKEGIDAAKPNAIRIFVTTKADLEDDYVYSYDEIEKFSKQNGLIHIKTSAKTGLGVNEVFETAAKEIIKRNKKKHLFYINLYLFHFKRVIK